MAQPQEWRRIVASALDWEQAHASLDHAIEGLPAELRGRRPERFPHSAWELLDHIRRTQRDLLEFMTNESYEEITWPDDYWPSSAAPASDAEWQRAVDDIHRDTRALADFTIDDPRDLTQTIPHGSGQTYLRTVIVAVDHMSYHVGQIVAVRRLLGAWTTGANSG
jgi:uncharacterized damage-inducible protein DinB